MTHTATAHPPGKAKAKTQGGKPEGHADLVWARAKALQARGEHAYAEKAFARHDALMVRAARCSDARPESEKAGDAPTLRERAAAHARARAEAEARADRPKTLRERVAEHRKRKAEKG